MLPNWAQIAFEPYSSPNDQYSAILIKAVELNINEHRLNEGPKIELRVLIDALNKLLAKNNGLTWERPHRDAGRKDLLKILLQFCLKF